MAHLIGRVCGRGSGVWLRCDVCVIGVSLSRDYRGLFKF